MRQFFIFVPLVASAAMAAVNSHFRSIHPLTPNHDAAELGGALGALSVLIGLYIVFFERHGPKDYRKAWPRYGIAIILWIGGCVMMELNLHSARP